MLLTDAPEFDILLHGHGSLGSDAIRSTTSARVVGGAAAWPLAARVQQPKVARIGFLGLVSPTSHASRLAAFRAGLRDLGWVEGRNMFIEFRWAEGN